MPQTQPHRERPPLTHREPARPTLTLIPGVRLRSAVLLAQATIDADMDPTDDLVGALAYTAAIGETCLVANAADAVREAARCLRAGARAEARAALIHAEKHLAVLVWSASVVATSPA